MADWKVSAERIKLFPHPNADKLLVAQVGEFPLVVGKSNEYVDDQIVIFAPKRSILPEWLRPYYNNEQTGESYLKNGTTVRSIKLRGEISEGCTISPDLILEKLSENNETKQFPDLVDKSLEDIVGLDLSEFLGITEYIPPIPSELSGKVKRLPYEKYSFHDVENFTINKRRFIEGELVVVTEKLHGSQVNIIRDADMNLVLSSKGIIKRGLLIEESDTNMYWKAVRNTNLKQILDEAFPGLFVQVMGECGPCQGGFNYGWEEETIKLFRIEIENVHYSIVQLVEMAKDNPKIQPIINLWVPVLYVGVLDEKEIIALSKGKETVSGKQLHIKEGVVVEPAEARPVVKNGSPLMCKVINPKYKGEEDDDAIS